MAVLSITVLIQRAAYGHRPAVRAGTWVALAAAGLLMCLSLPIFPNDLQAYGNNLVATALIAGALVWHILHPPSITKLEVHRHNEPR